MQTSGSNSSSDSGQHLNATDWMVSTPKQLPPWKERLCKSLNNSYVSSQSDSSTNSAQVAATCKKKNKRRTIRLPPVGIFWDIENCQVPKNKSASAVVSRIREFFYQKYREAEFLVVCDVKKEHPQVVQELHDSQVNLIHVASTSKNAADEKLRQSLRRFAEVHAAPSCVVLISGDINFAADLSDLRYRKKIRVILLHNSNVADALILCANEHYLYPTITEAVPKQKPNKCPQTDDSAFLLISNLPVNSTLAMIKNRLTFLTNNCGGRVTEILLEDGLAFVRFSNLDAANRAQKRIQGEDVFGNKIRAVTPSLRNYAGRKVKGGDGAFRNQEQKRFSHELMNQPTDFGNRRPRTPLDTFHRVRNTSGSSELSDASTKYDTASNSKPVDLIISNLDPTINPKELRRMLVNIIKECTMIVSLNVNVQSDGTPIANLRVNNQHAAQYVISQLHRQKLGHKRIVVSYAQSNSPDPEQLRAMVISILQEVPDNHMPLFKFIELLESRFHCTVSVSEMNKLKDICKITDNSGARIISFAQEIKASPPPNLHKTLVPYCIIHCSNGMPNLGWCELTTIQPSNIHMPLKQFATKLHTLLNLHLGCMPLLTFQTCYEHEFQEALPIDLNGVPLEHLIACVKNIEIQLTGPNKNIKLIKRDFKSADAALTDEEAVLKQVPPALVSNIHLFCRELVDLLKTTERCQILLSKFIPAYHHHFGRQCHVADYGYTKLLDLFEAIGHVVQIMGDSTRKTITLTHQAQMRRFTSDLLRVLKVQPCKQMAARNFAAAYEKVLNKAFNPVDYGLCYFEDLLEEVPDNVVVLTSNEVGEVVVAVPKREQTSAEIMRTKQFAVKVIDLLRHAPNCTMLFNKFVPAYHHHFGHQCRVSDYGFGKLVELFEAIPDVVTMHELPDGERTVSLTPNQALKVLGNQLINLAKNMPHSHIPLGELPRLYLKEYGYPLRTQTYGCGDVVELLDKLSDCLQVVESGPGPSLTPLNSDTANTVLKIRVWALLLNAPHCKDLRTFTYEYQSRYRTEAPPIHVLGKQLRQVVSLSAANHNDANYIALTDCYVLAAQLYQLLYKHGGSVMCGQVEALYAQHFGKPMQLQKRCGANGVEELYDKFEFLFFACGYKKRVLALNRGLAEYQIAIPAQITNAHGSSTQKKWPPPPPIPAAVKPAPIQCGGGALKKVSPPKPDTPPTPQVSTSTVNPWRRDSCDVDLLNLAIPMPIIQNPQIMGDPYELISPARHLFTASRNPWTAKAPDASELPIPDKLIMQKPFFEDEEDSGVNSKMEVSNNDSGMGGNGALVKRQGYLNFDD